MEKYSRSFKKLESRQGVVAIMVGLMMVVFVGLAALAIDIGHLYVVRNELQNAADAGALAGARFLYTAGGTALNTGANQIAYDVATSNKSESVPVDVNWTAGTNQGDVQRGHWSFATRTFTPNSSTTPVNLWNVTTSQLDADPNFINAVRVVTRRQNTPAASFFARIFGYGNFSLSTEAIAYIGFAGTLEPGEGDQPIAICMDSIKDPITGEYSCNIGRMINSGQQVATQETGGWTDFNQNSPCLGGTNAQTVRSLVCSNGNPEPLSLGWPMASNGGDIQAAFADLLTCWKSAADSDGDGIPDNLWNLTLPVINCPGNNVGTCEDLVGAVNINIVWITEAGTDPLYNNVPTKMDNWVCPPGSTGAQCWASFVAHFQLQNLDGSAAPYDKKSIYFLPDCNPHELNGKTGGENFGILAKVPVLVK